MPSVRIGQVAGVISRHLCGYAELFQLEAAREVDVLRRRVLMVLTATLFALISVALGLVWIVAAVWDDPRRLWVIGGLAALFALGALVAGWGSRTPGDSFGRLKRQWAEDREMLSRIGTSLQGPHHD